MEPMSYRKLARSVSTRIRCPVCHEEVYSRAGIHPQCAARQCDPPRPKGKAVVPIPTVPTGQATEGAPPVIADGPSLAPEAANAKVEGLWEDERASIESLRTMQVGLPRSPWREPDRGADQSWP